jgi:cysteine desulfurase
MATALKICADEMQGEMARLAGLRCRLFDSLTAALDEIRLNGPALDRPGLRLPGNLNVSFGGVDGETLLLNVPRLAASSGSACTSAHSQPSHVLRALGLSDEAVRASIRFGLGRGNTEAEVDAVAEAIIDSVRRLRRLSSRSVLQSGA